jgi:methyl-accepting chemotaxis protein
VKRKDAKDSLISKFPLLSVLGAAFCFLVVPFVLLDVGLERMLSLRHEQETTAVFKQMDSRLEFLLRHSDDQHYFHAIFKRIFTRATTAKDPLASIEKSISQLRKRFGKHLEFIVWDHNGQKVAKLSDEKRYHYIVKNLYLMFQEVAQNCLNNYPGYPETLPIVSEKVNLFRSYLGRFMVPAHLRLPYQAGIQGACIHADTEDRKPLFWFHAASELTFFCSISGALLNKNSGLQHAIEVLNNSDPIISGIIHENKVYPPTDPETEQEILLELGKFENAAMPHRITAANLISFKLLNPDMRGFCRRTRSELDSGYPDKLRKIWMSRMIIGFLLAAFVFYCYNLRLGRLRFSIRLKLALLFLYATGLPLMILGTIGYEYLQQQRYNLIKETHAANEKLLLELDSGYNRFRQSLSQKAHEQLQDFRKKMLQQEPDASMTQVYDRILKSLEAEEIHIFNQSGQIRASHRRHRKPTSQTFMKIFAAGALTFVNQKTDDEFNKLVENAGASLRIVGKTVLERGSGILQTLLAKLERIEKFNFGTQTKLCFTTLLGDRSKRNFHSFMIIVWREEEAQANYVKKELEKFNAKNSGRFLAANVLVNGLIINPSFSSNRQILPVLQKAATLQTYNEDSLKIGSESFIASAIGGKALNNLTLLALSPISGVEKQIERDKNHLLIFIFVSLTLSTGVALALSGQFLEPVKQLASAVIQIGKRNFRYRTSILSNDEFGDLGKVFNASMEELEKLEIGRVVQENLFPGNRFSHDSVEIFARSVTMTRLGGDYYDFFAVDDRLTGVFMGDVAGHGIPAALIMAMAKASVLTRREIRNSPDQMLAAIHQMLFTLKSNQFKRMMTCQYMTIDGATGTLCMANAGHCFPIVVSSDGSTAKFHEIIGTPVGITKRARYTNFILQLEPGDTVILYSDGMIEASNQNGEAFGANRLLDLARTSWNENLEQYYDNMFSANQHWAREAEDDLTIVLVRFKGKGALDV